MCGECNWPTELTRKDMEETYDKLMKSTVFFPKCNWCNESHFVREVGPNYICPECESKERAAGRPLIFTSPVRGAHFKLDVLHSIECECKECLDKWKKMECNTARKMHREIMDWIRCSDELPPRDGLYEVTNIPEVWGSQGILEYDGYGFRHEGSYRPVSYWRAYAATREKRYGKINKENS